MSPCLRPNGHEVRLVGTDATSGRNRLTPPHIGPTFTLLARASEGARRPAGVDGHDAHAVHRQRWVALPGRGADDAGASPSLRWVVRREPDLRFSTGGDGMKRMLGVGAAAVVLAIGMMAHADDEPAGRELMRTEKKIQANLQ